MGKRVNEFSMADDQKYILKKIIKAVECEKPDAVFIAGDVYDKSVPSTEAVEMFDDFLYELCMLKTKTFVISGNHDSPERIAFGGRIIKGAGVYLSPVYDGSVAPVTLNDEYGEVNIYMLPFIKPAHVRKFFGDSEINSYTDAVRVAVEHMNINASARNVLITHQFVTGATRCESEELNVGGADNVDASVFVGFDYVALGHIHGPQNACGERVRYCGSPIKYSFSEASHVKSITVAELKNRGELTVKTIPLTPLRDMIEIRGTYNELMSKSFYEGLNYNTDYVHITLTDEQDIPDAVNRLRTVYGKLMRLDYDNARTRFSGDIGAADVEKSPLELMGDFYELQNNAPMSDEQSKLCEKLIEKIWGENQ